MLRALVGVTVAGLFLATPTVPAAAQDVRLEVSWGTPGVHAGVAFRSGAVGVRGRVDGYDRPAPRARVEQRHYTECVTDGPYLYCWDAPRVYRGRAELSVRPVVHVYLTDRALAHRNRSGRHGWSRADLRWHQAVALRYWRRWADAHRFAYDRNRLRVDVTLAW
jgi:hypothetical protein